MNNVDLTDLERACAEAKDACEAAKRDYDAAESVLMARADHLEETQSAHRKALGKLRFAGLRAMLGE